ncbi:MAG: DUF1501 domain-containing protein [Rhodospirillaceae bacterium]|nr:DUF1501 domain-containing protein [Rhodospirillaceae bacterium]
MTLSRRDALRTAASSAALAAVGPGLKVAMAQVAQAADTLIVLYLRGGSDGLQMVSPAGDPNYIANRPGIRVQTTGNNAGLGIGTLDGTDFYLHYGAPELKALYDKQQLAVVHAVGLRNEDRSHFESQERMELGANLNEQAPDDGWLTRHLKALSGTRPQLGTISVASNIPVSLLSYAPAVAIPNAQSFNVSGGTANANIIRALNGGSTGYETTAIQTLNAVAQVQAGFAGLPADNTNYGYTTSALGASLRALAQMMKSNLQVEVAHVDMGGWDHHDGLIGEFNARTVDLSRNLNAFWTEIEKFQSKTTLVTMTEFGRRVRENASAGTDHGSGSYMFVLGGNVNGGKIYGDWPGLAANQLFNGDLDTTTDFRRVVSEVLAKRQGARNLDKVFPTVKYEPLGIVKGDDTGVISGSSGSAIG